MREDLSSTLAEANKICHRILAWMYGWMRVSLKDAVILRNYLEQGDHKRAIDALSRSTPKPEDELLLADYASRLKPRSSTLPTADGLTPSPARALGIFSPAAPSCALTNLVGNVQAANTSDLIIFVEAIPVSTSTRIKGIDIPLVYQHMLRVFLEANQHHEPKYQIAKAWLALLDIKEAIREITHFCETTTTLLSGYLFERFFSLLREFAKAIQEIPELLNAPEHVKRVCMDLSCMSGDMHVVARTFINSTQWTLMRAQSEALDAFKRSLSAFIDQAPFMRTLNIARILREELAPDFITFKARASADDEEALLELQSMLAIDNNGENANACEAGNSALLLRYCGATYPDAKFVVGRGAVGLQFKNLMEKAIAALGSSDAPHQKLMEQIINFYLLLNHIKVSDATLSGDNESIKAILTDQPDELALVRKIYFSDRFDTCIPKIFQAISHMLRHLTELPESNALRANIQEQLLPMLMEHLALFQPTSTNTSCSTAAQDADYFSSLIEKLEAQCEMRHTHRPS